VVTLEEVHPPTARVSVDLEVVPAGECDPAETWISAVVHGDMCRLRREPDQCCLVIQRVLGTAPGNTQATVAAAPFLAGPHRLTGELVERSLVNEWMQNYNF